MSLSYFYTHYFAPQHVVRRNRVFSKEHIILTTIIVIAIWNIMRVQRKRHDVAFSQKWLRGLGIVMAALEAFRIGWRTYYYGPSIANLRFDWCNQICLVMPWIAIFRVEKAYPYVDVAAFIGGTCVLIYPLWVFYDYAGFHIMAAQSMVSHGLMVTIALTMPLASENGYRRGNFADMNKRITGLCIMLLVALIASRTLNTNYLLMLSADGIPVLENIPYPYYWLIAFPMMVLGLFKFSDWLGAFDAWMLKLPKHSGHHQLAASHE